MCFTQNVYKSVSCTLLVLVVSLSVHAQSVIINELMAINKKSIADGFGEHEDWLELYNPGNQPFNIRGIFYMDDLYNSTKYLPINLNG